MCRWSGSNRTNGTSTHFQAASRSELGIPGENPRVKTGVSRVPLAGPGPAG